MQGEISSERVFSDSGGENVKSDGFEREGQGRYYIDNCWGGVLEDEGSTPSEQPRSSRFSLSP